MSFLVNSLPAKQLFRRSAGYNKGSVTASMRGLKVFCLHLFGIRCCTERGDELWLVMKEGMGSENTSLAKVN